MNRLRIWNNDGKLFCRDLTKKGKRKTEMDVLRERTNNICRICERVHWGWDSLGNMEESLN